MKSGNCVRAAVAAAVVSLLTPSAMAQGLNQLSEAQKKEMACVSEKLLVDEDAAYDVVEAYLYTDDSAQIERAETAVKAAGDACSVAYNWGASKLMLSEAISVSSMVVDYLTGELLATGLKEEQVQLIFTTLDKLPEEDLRRFLDDSWLDDAAFIKRLNVALAAAKYPSGSENILEDAHLIMEGTIIVTAGMADWARLHSSKQ